MKLATLAPAFAYFLSPEQFSEHEAAGTISCFSVSGYDQEGKHHATACSELLGALIHAHKDALTLDTVSIEVNRFALVAASKYRPEHFEMQTTEVVSLTDLFGTLESAGITINEIHEAICVHHEPAELTA